MTNFNCTIPGVVYSHPEAASCGCTEDQAIAEGRDVKIAKMQMRANGRFIAENAGENGLCKLVIDAKTNALIGVHLIGGSCSEMIYGAAALIEAEFRVDDVKQIVFPHPTVSEIIKDSLWELE